MTPRALAIVAGVAGVVLSDEETAALATVYRVINRIYRRIEACKKRRESGPGGD